VRAGPKEGWLVRSRSAAKPSAVLAWMAVVTTMLATVAGCRGPGDVRFDHESCYIDGRLASLPQVEEREVSVGHRIAARQPWLVAITIVVVSLAGISYVERLVLLFSARRDARSMGDRLKALIERYRAHPIRYFSLVGGTVGLLLLAAALYIYIDADKRASERALATLQFCHLALRTNDEKKALDDQRRNLTSLHETTGAIRQLIDKLPPAEQLKAQEIVGHMDEAVRHEGRLIADHLQKSEDTAQAIRDGTQSIARDLTGLDNRVAGLMEIPAAVRSVADAVHKLETRAAAGDESLVDVGNKLATLGKSVDAIESRLTPTCPACVCQMPAVPSPARGSDAAVK
jgi:hypothetical protein